MTAAVAKCNVERIELPVLRTNEQTNNAFKMILNVRFLTLDWRLAAATTDAATATNKKNKKNKKIKK